MPPIIAALHATNITQLQRIEWQHRPLFAVSMFMFVAMVMSLLWWLDGALFELIFSNMGDAYIGVSVFVAATLAVFYSANYYLQKDIGQSLQRATVTQVPLAAFLGALPGCGGAIIVVTQFVKGRVSFGALVAVLISTMGDAAFLLISQKPQIALVVYGLSMFAGVITGWLVNAIHGANYLAKSASLTTISKVIPEVPSAINIMFIALLLPGSLLGVAEALQVDTTSWFGVFASYEPVAWIAFLGACLCLVVWLIQPLDSWSARFSQVTEHGRLTESLVAETSFISVWVMAGFLCYELWIYYTGMDPQVMFVALGSWTILLAVVIGLVPGCGPQILVTGLYLNGVIPLSAQLANAISNDGDALFPALAMAPKAALVATLYSTMPALIIGYAAYSLGF